MILWTALPQQCLNFVDLPSQEYSFPRLRIDEDYRPCVFTWSTVRGYQKGTFRRRHWMPQFQCSSRIASYPAVVRCSRFAIAYANMFRFSLQQYCRGL
jgi:hypothetical protein